MDEYLDHLAPDGMIVFVSQPIDEKLQCFRALFEERGLGEAANAMFAWGWPELWMLDSLVVVPGGLSPADVATLRAEIASWRANATILYEPSGKGVDRTVRLVTEPLDPAALVTDDRPFTQPIVLSEFELFPSKERLSDPMYLASWTKVFTVGLFALVCGAVALVAGLAGGRAGQVPWPWVGYLLASGVGFMCVEIPLIARTELFVGNPLYAVALNLALFLVASACGAMLQDRFRARSGPLVLVAVAVLGVAWGLGGSALLDGWLLWSPLPVKALALAVVVFPVGIALGMFYPYAVDRLVREGRPATVPMSYCLSTLSSVLGSSFAMTAMIDLGFTRVITLGAALYVVAGAIALARKA
jgi:hypothetical protein